MSVGIVGLGYVGLPLAVAFAEAGQDVIALDISAERVAALTSGDSYIEDVTAASVQQNLKRITATTDFQALTQADAILICVPTPLSINREPDLGPLIAAATQIAEVACKGQLVVLESTTYPGTTREQLAPLFERKGLQAGSDLNLAFSPERVDPGRTDYTMRTTPKVVGGLTDRCTARAAELYGQICDQVVPVSSPEAAELTKLLENIFRSVNIALVNELAMLADRMEIDIWEVVDAAATKPFGFTRFDPGPGMGGHCLPVDPFYLAWKAREYDLPTEFVEVAGKVNQRMPYYCVERVERALNDAGKPVHGAQIALLGVSYKAGVGDVRESPALKIIELLEKRGAQLGYHDPYVPSINGDGMTSQPLDEVLAGADLAVLVTAHPEFSYDQIAAAVPLLLDLRGVTRELSAPNVTRL